MAKRSKPAKKRVKAVPKKKTVVKKKAAAKKVATKKVVAKKKAPVKKIAAKKVTTKKAVAKPVSRKAVKKTPAKKVAAKKAAVKKKVAPVKQLKPTVIPKESLPPVTELSEELVERAAHSNGNGIQEKIVNGEGPDVPLNTEDPVRSFDKHVFEKATVKGDPQSKLHLSSVSKSGIRPSGKKPLFKR